MRLHVVTTNRDRDLLHVDTDDGPPRKGDYIDIGGIHYPVEDVTWGFDSGGVAHVLVEVIPATNTSTKIDAYLAR